MAIARTCLNCGAPLFAAADQEFCSKCLFMEAAAGVFAAYGKVESARNSAQDGRPTDVAAQTGGTIALQSPAFPLGAGTLFGDYELLEPIGRGGMGVVYRARQLSLNRVVAIKMMAFAPGSSPDLVKRFRAEAVAAGALQHPNIVPIHEVGIHAGTHFFVMDYVPGQSLAELVSNQALPASRAAACVKKVAEAVHYAHQRGILHRDLKPSNIIVDDNDEPHVVDFGLAKRFSDSELSTLNSQTVTGQLLGSPQYLPPEQATVRHGPASRRSDVYGLGATLYHLLTARPPFQAESLPQTIDLVLNAEPVPPRLLNPGLPLDLETICLKCLEKEPAKRYASAQALAEELGRFLEGKPILASPLGRVGKTWRWCRRKPQMAAALGAATLCLVLGFVGISWEWRQAELQRRRALAGELWAQRRAYVSEVNLAQQALAVNNPGRALQLLNRHRPAASGLTARYSPDLRNWEWRYLWEDCQTEAECVVGSLPNCIRALEVSPGAGEWLLAGSESGGAKLWNLLSGEQILLAPERGITAYGTFSPDGRWVLFTDQALESYGTIGVWDLQGRKRLPPIVDPRPVGPMAFSPDSRWFGYGFAIPSQRSTSFGKGVVVRAFPGYEKIKEVSALTPINDGDHANDWVFTGDSRAVIYGEAEPDHRIAHCEFRSGSEPSLFAGHSEAITALAFSPAAPVLATGSGYTNRDIKLWEVPSFRPVGELSGHQGWIRALRFSPDGRTLASSGSDSTIRLWDLVAKKQVRVFARLPSAASRLCFAPDGEKLYSGGIDGTIYRWPAHAAAAEPRPAFWRRAGGLNRVTLSPDGSQFAGLRAGAVCLGGTQPGTAPRPLLELGTNNTCVRFSANGRHLFAGTRSGEIQVWPLGGGPVRRLPGSNQPVGSLWESRGGQLLLALHREEKTSLELPVQVSFWNTAAWRVENTLKLKYVQYCCAVSPDGRWLASAFQRGPLRLSSLAGLAITETAPCRGRPGALAFSPDGTLLAGGNAEGMVQVWEVPKLRKAAEFQACSQGLFALAFSPDGLRLAVAGREAEAIKLWDVASWQELITLPLEGEELTQIFFSSDGHQISARNSQGDFVFWRTPTFEEIALKEKHHQ